MTRWLIGLTAAAIASCAQNEPESGPERRDRGRFSDTRFLCDGDNLALWARLQDEGTDLSAYGLACNDASEKTIVVRDSLIDAETEEVSSHATADAVAGPDSESGSPDSEADPMPDADDDADSEPPADDEDAGADPDAITYTARLKALIDSDCVSCHAAGGTPPRLDGYANAKAAGPASLVSIDNNAMPVGAPWSPADKALFREWADAGFPQ